MGKSSAGIVIIYQDLILLAHPTHGSDVLWGISKGGIDAGETPLQAAIRETREEIGFDVKIEDLEKDPIIFEYVDKKGKKYKTVYCYILKLKTMPAFVENNIWPTMMLQLEEIDKAKFYTKTEAENKIFWRMENLLSLLK